MGEQGASASGCETLATAVPSHMPIADNASRNSETLSPTAPRAADEAMEHLEAPAAPPLRPAPRRRSGVTSALVLALIVGAIVALSAWYLTRPTPLMIQGEADSTRIDIAARVDGRLERLLVERGETVAAGQQLLEIDNPELLAKLDEAKAGRNLAEAELARVHAGTRAETIAVRKAEIDRAAADLTLAQNTHDRRAQLAAKQVASQQQLDEATDALRVAERSHEQATRDEPRSGAPRSIDDARIEAVIVRTLETLPPDATHWSSRGMAMASGLLVSTV